MLKWLFNTVLAAFVYAVFVSGIGSEGFPADPPYLKDSTSTWVDSVLKGMTLEEKIGQLFMVPAYSNELADNRDEIAELVEDYNIGGLLFFQGSPVRQASLTNFYQSKAKVPLLIAMDAEYGLGMRLDSTIKYPRQMTLGALQNDQLIYNMGADIAQQMKMLGIHVNLAPVVDVNNNPENPVINSRSFGEDKHLVAQKGLQYMMGLQDNRIIATAKHFPGHGDTDKDSHQSLPVINHTRERMEKVEFYPFKKLIDYGVGGIMIAHLYAPALDPNEKMASTLSPVVVQDILREELGFKGLIYTDALNMKGISESNRKGDIDMEAFLAGNDILLFPDDVPKGVKKIRKAVKDGLVSERELDRRVRKILAAKKWVGADEFDSLNTENLVQRLNAPKFELTKRRCIANSITLLRNEDTLLPVKDLAQSIATVSINAEDTTAYQEMISNYCSADHYFLPGNASVKERSDVQTQLKNYDLILVGVHGTKESPELNWGISQGTIDFLRVLNLRKNVVISIFGNPYSLSLFDDLYNSEGIVMAYQDGKLYQEYAAQAIFGGVNFKGKLPVTASRFYNFGDGITTDSVMRFSYTIPEEVNIHSRDLAHIDELANWGIEERAYPGCQILVAKEQKVIYHKTFGHHTYRGDKPVKKTDLYDLASITKIAATLPSFMLLEDRDKVSLYNSLCDYLPGLVDSTDYFSMSLQEMLAHQAGLRSWIPFYKETLVSGEPKYQVYSLVPSETYPYRVAEGFYIHKDYPDSIMRTILTTPLRRDKDYRYSDLGYYFLKMIIEKQSGWQLEDFAAENFYKPLGMGTTGFLPRKRFPLSRVPPTEYDLMFRKQQVHGDVHDPGAAMLGGVGGHAGVFSSANDLAKLMQLYLNWGVYGGKRYLTEQRVKEYAKCQFCEEDNRRGAGFDKPVREGTGGPTCQCISYESYGHTGFTGTMAWVDPVEEVVYIFLSNRVYPSASNSKLIKMDIRTRIMETVFSAIEQGKIETLTGETTLK